MAQPANMFDQFDEPAGTQENPFDAFDKAEPALMSNPFDQFDAAEKPQAVQDPEVAAYESAGGGVLTSLERGGRRLKQTLAGAGAALGDALIDDEGWFDTSPVGEWLQNQTELDKGEVMQHQQAIEALPQHPTMGKAVHAANEADGYVGAARAFLGKVWDSPDTSGFLIDSAAEMAPQAVTMLLGTKGADKLLPVFMRGMGRTTAAMAGGGFINSVANTYGTNLAESLQQGLEYDQAEARAALQSITQGGIDALTSAVVPWKIGPNQFTNMPAQTLVQMLGGATGEIARSKVVGETATQGDVAAEALLEVLGLPGDVLASFKQKSAQAQPEVAPVASHEQVVGVAETEVGNGGTINSGINPAENSADQEIGASVETFPVDDAPTPENPETLQAQLRAFEEGRKPAVLLTPGESIPDLPAGAQVAEIPNRGTLIYKDPVVLELAQSGRMGEALGYGISEKPLSDQVVTARDENGVVVQDVMSDGSPAVTEAARRVAGPGGSVEVRPALDALVERHQGGNGGTTQAVTDATFSSSIFKVEPISEKNLIVLGDKDQIRSILNEAGVTLKGLPNKQRGGLIFPMKHQKAIRAALAPKVPPMQGNPAPVQPTVEAPVEKTAQSPQIEPVETELPPSGADAFAPGSGYVGFIQDTADTKPETQAKPIRREDVLIPFLKALDVPLYQGRVKGKGRLGFYLPKKEAVRIRNKGDLETASHELAHLIDDRVPEIRKAWQKDKALREELRSISYDHKKVYEGFAEGVRLWMTQPETLAQVAPRFNDWFNQFAERHEYGPALKNARKGMTDWFAQDALTRAKSKIGNSKPINESLHNVFHSFRQAVSDDLDGLYKMERKLTGQINPAGSYETARLTRGAFSMVEGALTIGAPVANPDGSFAFKGKSLEAILEPVSDRIEEWTRYAVGRSAQELLLQNREHLFTPAEITAMLRLETPEFKQAFRDYQTWNKRVVDFAQTLGVINPETRKLWRRVQYLPFYRVNTDHRPRAESNVSGDWRGVQRLTGGTDNIRDVLQNMIQNASQLIVQAVRNEARASVADMADKIRGGGRFMVKIPRGIGQTKISKAEIMRIVEQAGIVPDDVVTDYSRLKDLVTVFQFGQPPKGKNVVAVMREGKADYYEVSDPLLMRSLQALDRPAKNWVTRFLGGFRRIGQSSITLSLDFISANLARDTLMGGIMSKHGFRPFVDSIRGMKSRVMKDPAYQEFIANGGGFSSVYLDDQAFRKRLERFYGRKGINYRTVIDTPAKLLYFLETLANAFEMSTRLGEFKRAREKGAKPRHAAYSAREISTDFAMRGDSEALGFLFDTVMFLKAGINGMDRLYRGFADDSNRRQIAVKTALLALASTALYALNRDNDLYDKLEDWDKDSHWHFFIPKAGVKPDAPLEERYHHFRYPKLWEIGAISSMAERSMENLLNGTPKKLGKDYLRIVLDQFKLDYVPQAIEPLYEQYLNRSRFTDAPIETQTMEQLAPFARSKPYTAKVLQEVGLASRNLPRALQVPPARTEALLRGYLNTWAMYGLSLADAALYDDKPDMRVDDYPVLRRFYAAEPAKWTKYETQFYDMLREATELRRTIRQMDKIGRPDIADEIETRKEVDRYKQLTRSNEELQAINREMRQLYIDDRMTPEQKRQKLDSLTHEKNLLLEAVVKDIESQEVTNDQ